MEELLFGIPVPALVVLVVELLKMIGIVSTSDHARVANILVSALCSVALVYTVQIPEQYMQIITLGFVALYNIVVAAIGYNATIGAKKAAI